MRWGARVENNDTRTAAAAAAAHHFSRISKVGKGEKERGGEREEKWQRSGQIMTDRLEAKKKNLKIRCCFRSRGAIFARAI